MAEHEGENVVQEEVVQAQADEGEAQDEVQEQPNAPPEVPAPAGVD
jgi:hypothetical protein